MVRGPILCRSRRQSHNHVNAEEMAVNRVLCCVKSLCLTALLAVLSIGVLSCSNIYLELACGGGAYASPAFPIEELLLDESVFPEGWHAEQPFDPEQWLPAQQIALFYKDGCPGRIVAALLEVYRFSDGPRCAAAGYQKEIPTWFAPREGRGPWRIPAELPYQSAVADQFRFGCSTYRGSSDQVCRAMGQYDEYVLRFQTHVDHEHPECMSFADLDRILGAIDERMAFYLGKEIE